MLRSTCNSMRVNLWMAYVFHSPDSLYNMSQDDNLNNNERRIHLALCKSFFLMVYGVAILFIMETERETRAVVTLHFQWKLFSTDKW